MDNVNESNEGFGTPVEAAASWDTQENVDHAAKLGGVPEGVHISLEEAPLEAPAGMVGIQVPVNVIMDQIHQHWARQLADQIQRNAELAAALTSVSDELNEVQGKLAALTEVTNAPADDAPARVRDIPAGPQGRQEG